jgi:hypothetical protein
MATTPLGVYYPVGTDDATDLRATFQRQAESVGIPKEFNTVAEANSRATSNPTYAKSGLTVWIKNPGASYTLY